MVEVKSESWDETICTLDHAEYGDIKFKYPAGLSIEVCPWHNADGTFDREAYEETLK